MKILPAFFIFLVIFTGLAEAVDEHNINKALEEHKGETYTLPAGTYYISDSIKVPEGKTLRGEVSEDGEILTKIILVDNARLSLWVPLIDMSDNSGLANLDIDANSENQGNVPTWKGHNGKGQPKQTGQGYHNCVRAQYCKNINFENLKLHNGLGDGLRIINSNNIEINNVKAWKLGHDAIFIIRSEAFWISNCYIQPRVSCGIRVMSSKHGRIFDNYIIYVPTYNGVRYDAGSNILIQQDTGVTEDIEILGNVLYNSCGPGLWLADKAGGESNVKISWNLFSGCGSNHGIYWAAGVIANGYDATFKHNVFDGCYLGSFVSYAVNTGWETEANTVFDSNIFTNTVPGAQSGEGGYALYNKLDQEIVSKNNCFWNNKAGNAYGCTLSDSDIFVNPKKQETPSGWEWKSNEWTCEKVTPSTMERVTGDNSYGPISDEEIQKSDDIFDILDTELTETGNIEQKNVKIVNGKWEKKGNAEACIYLAGYKGEITLGEDKFLPQKPSECAWVLTKTHNLADRPISQDSSLKLKDGANNTLIAELKVKTRFEVKRYKEIIGIKIPYYKVRSETSTFTRTFPGYHRFPTVKAPKCKVLHYNGSHAIVIIPDTPGVIKTEIKLNNSTAKEFKFIGEIGTLENGFRCTNFTKVSAWRFTGLQMSKGSDGIYVKEPFNVSNLKITVFTPFDRLEVTDIEYVRIEDTSTKIFNLGNLTLLVLIMTYGRAIYKIFNREFKRWFKNL